MSFSDTYINSIVVRKILEGIPEEERETFLSSLRQSISMFDGYVGDASLGSMLRESPDDSIDGIPKQEGRRPPRRR